MKVNRQNVLELLEPICRVGLGGLFVYSAWGKIDDPGMFAEMVMKYEMLPTAVVGLFSLTLPMVELLVGFMIVFTKWLRESALVMTGLLCMFLVALSVAVARGLEIDCGCFGVSAGGGRRELVLAIVRDIALMVPSAWLMFRRNSWIGVRGVVVLLALLLVVGGGSLVGKAMQSDAPKAKPKQTTSVKSASKGRKARAGRSKPTRRAAQPAAGQHREKPDIDVDDEDLSPADKKIKDAIDAALDEEDLAAARALSSKALAAESPEVRQAMVDTLGWFGVKALPELTPFLADPDEDVRDSAMNEWSMALTEIEDDAEKLGVVELAMHVLSDEDALEDISGEYIGVDEKLAVESLLRIIEAGGSETGVEKAKETYEFVTGEEFVDRAQAEKWIAEEYEPPEQQDGSKEDDA